MASSPGFAHQCKRNRFVNYIPWISLRGHISFLVHSLCSSNIFKRAFLSLSGYKNTWVYRLNVWCHFDNYVSFLSDFTCATVFQLVARILVCTSTSHHNWAAGWEASGRKIYFSVLHTDVQLAVLRQKITKKRGELIAATGTSITLYYTVEPSSLCDSPRGFLSIGDLSRLSLSTNMYKWTENCKPHAGRERATEDKQRWGDKERRRRKKGICNERGRHIERCGRQKGLKW